MNSPNINLPSGAGYADSDAELSKAEARKYASAYILLGLVTAAVGAVMVFAPTGSVGANWYFLAFVVGGLGAVGRGLIYLFQK